MDFKSKLKKLRINQKMTQESVAQKAGIPLRTYISYERGVTPQRRETYEKLATALGCSVEELILDTSKSDNITKIATVAGTTLVGVLSATTFPAAAIMGVAIGCITLLKAKSPQKNITASDIEKTLNEKIRTLQTILEKKRIQLEQLQSEIEAEELNIQKYQAALTTLDLNAIADEVNASTQQEELYEKN